MWAELVHHQQTIKIWYGKYELLHLCRCMHMSIWVFKYTYFYESAEILLFIKDVFWNYDHSGSSSLFFSEKHYKYTAVQQNDLVKTLRSASVLILVWVYLWLMERGNSYICKFPCFISWNCKWTHIRDITWIRVFSVWGLADSLKHIFFRPEQTTENVFITTNTILYFLSKAHTRV